MELLILLVGGIVTGVFIGVLPAFPVYVGAFILTIILRVNCIL